MYTQCPLQFRQLLTNFRGVGYCDWAASLSHALSLMKAGGIFFVKKWARKCQNKGTMAGNKPNSISSSTAQSRRTAFSTQKLSASQRKTRVVFLPRLGCCQWWRQSPLGYCRCQTQCNRGRWKHLPKSTEAPWEPECRGRWSHSGRWFDRTRRSEKQCVCIQPVCKRVIGRGGTERKTGRQLDNCWESLGACVQALGSRGTCIIIK